MTHTQHTQPGGAVMHMHTQQCVCMHCISEKSMHSLLLQIDTVQYTHTLWTSLMSSKYTVLRLQHIFRHFGWKCITMTRWKSLKLIGRRLKRTDCKIQKANKSGSSSMAQNINIALSMTKQILFQMLQTFKTYFMTLMCFRTKGNDHGLMLKLKQQCLYSIQNSFLFSKCTCRDNQDLFYQSSVDCLHTKGHNILHPQLFLRRSCTIPFLPRLCHHSLSIPAALSCATAPSMLKPVCKTGKSVQSQHLFVIHTPPPGEDSEAVCVSCSPKHWPSDFVIDLLLLLTLKREHYLMWLGGADGIMF